MEKVVSRSNMMAAYSRVVSNKGAPGIDGMTVGDLKGYLTKDWPRIKEELLSGTYHPQPVRKVEIPKPGGGLRMLGIPTVVDRLIQQALHQELMRLFEADFSESSYGFRPGRSARQTVKAARNDVATGRRRAAPCRRCCQISCLTIWTTNWKDEAIPSVVTLTTATSTCTVAGRHNAS